MLTIIEQFFCFPPAIPINVSTMSKHFLLPAAFYHPANIYRLRNSRLGNLHHFRHRTVVHEEEVLRRAQT